MDVSFDLNLILQLIEPVASATVFMLGFMLEYWYLAGPVLLIEYLILMKIWLIARDQWWERPFKILGGIFFIPQDIFVNILIATPLFLDLPKYWLVTHRMERYKNTGGQSSKNGGIDFGFMYNWRHAFAVKLCGILNPSQQALDGTDHC